MSIYARARGVFVAALAFGAVCVSGVFSSAEAQGLEWNACCYRTASGGLNCQQKGTNETESCLGPTYTIKANCNAAGSCTAL